MILVDTNVWTDLISDDPVWKPWSFQQLKTLSLHNGLVINCVIYAELSANYKQRHELDSFLQPTKVKLVEVSPDAAFNAGLAYLAYRRRQGTKTGVLPDFFIGAQAQAEGWTLLTRDSARYRTYFPTVKLVCPD